MAVPDPQFSLPLTRTIAPAGAQEMTDALRAAAEQKTAVYPCGGGTRSSYGATPRRPGLGLSLAGMNRLVDYPNRDLTVTVEAGMTMRQLGEILAANRQRLPVDVPDGQLATIGGAVATHVAGPRRFLWGTIRDYVLGFTAIDGTGTSFSAGGRVVKNAAGYDMCKLMVGSLGTLGVITQVTLMVRPLPETTAIVSRGLTDLDAAEELFARLNRSPLRPAAIELVAGPAWQDVSGLERLPASAAGRLLVGFEGARSEVSWMVEQLQQEWSGERVESALLSGDAADPVWTRLTDFARDSQRDGSDALTLEITCLPSQTARLARDMRNLDHRASLQAHAGNGSIIVVLPAGDPQRCPELIRQRIRPMVSAAGARLTVVGYPAGVSLSQSDVWGEPPAGLSVMQSIKRQFDPHNILNPGRYVFEE